MKMTMLFTLILSIFAFSACQPATTEKATGLQENVVQNEIKQVYPFEAKQAVKGNDVQFIDVRTAEEYAGGHATKAVHFPLDQLEKDLVKLDKNKPVYVICETGRRSQKGSEILKEAGFNDVYNVIGGTGAWLNAGLPTEKQAIEREK